MLQTTMTVTAAPPRGAGRCSHAVLSMAGACAALLLALGPSAHAQGTPAGSGSRIE